MDTREMMLLCRVRSRLCALPLAHVLETMRPLPIEQLGGMPAFVGGVSQVRGEVVPVVDPGLLLGLAEAPRPGRFVRVRAGARRVALSVEEVLGVRELDVATVRALPPLLGDANAEIVQALATLDDELLLVLNASRSVPDSVWQALSVPGPPSAEGGAR